MASSKWRMETAPSGMKRGACLECKDPATVDQELKSVCANGTSISVCDPCSKKPKLAKYMRGNND